VTVRSIVDIAGRVLSLAEHSPTGSGPQVTPVRVDELGLAAEILDPALRHVGATVLDVVSTAAEGCAGTITDLAREAAIAAALEHVAASGTRRPAFAEDRHGRRRAYWDDEVPPAGEQPPVHPLLGLATAAIDVRLATPDRLVVLTYDEAELEPLEKPVAWNYVTQILPSQLPAHVDHFVIVCASAGVEEHHLIGDPSLRWTVDGPRVLERNLKSTNDILTRRLLEPLDSHLVLFLGAGFSASMGMPLGNTMRDFALRRFLAGLSVPAYELPLKFFEFVADQDRLLEIEKGREPAELARTLTFERVLREELRTGTPSPTLAKLEEHEASALAATPVRAVRLLKTMLEARRRLVLITVNFDRLVEHHSDSLVEPFVDEESFAGCVEYLDRYLAGEVDADKVPLLKLHGSFSQQTSLIATIEQTLTGLSAAKASALERACRSTSGAPVPLVYVGSSMRDLDIGLQLAQPLYATGLDERWVMPLPAPAVVEFVRNHRTAPWTAAGVQATLEERTISWTADEFFGLLAPGWVEG
jgi:hypothetical protein